MNPVEIPVPLQPAKPAGLFRRDAIIAGLWLATIVLGTFLMVERAGTPGMASTPPVAWPAESEVSPDAASPNLLMFVHPRCPCSRASIGQLERIMTRCQGKVVAHVFFLKPAGVTESWVKSDIWDTADRIPGVTVHPDAGGAEARRFCAETSGDALLYSRTGLLAFHGGITSARGHFEDNPSSDSVVALIENGEAANVAAPVFGCALWNPETQASASTWTP